MHFCVLVMRCPERWWGWGPSSEDPPPSPYSLPGGTPPRVPYCSLVLAGLPNSGFRARLPHPRVHPPIPFPARQPCPPPPPQFPPTCRAACAHLVLCRSLAPLGLPFPAVPAPPLPTNLPPPKCPALIPAPSLPHPTPPPPPPHPVRTRKVSGLMGSMVPYCLEYPGTKPSVLYSTTLVRRLGASRTCLGLWPGNTAAPAALRRGPPTADGLLEKRTCCRTCFVIRPRGGGDEELL